jgi:hypothetical protein
MRNIWIKNTGAAVAALVFALLLSACPMASDPISTGLDGDWETGEGFPYAYCYFEVAGQYFYYYNETTGDDEDGVLRFDEQKHRLYLGSKLFTYSLSGNVLTLTDLVQTTTFYRL